MRISFHYCFAYLEMEFMDRQEYRYEDFDNLNNCLNYIEEFKKYLDSHYGNAHANYSESRCFANISFEYGRKDDYLRVTLDYHNINKLIDDKKRIEEIYNIICKEEV